jgi:3-hydroxyisobutyrate dehydrogenase-like beta-hydroxyacid dehydrogenase
MMQVPAANGKLIFVCGGDAAVFERLQADFSVMGKLSKLYGPIGYGDVDSGEHRSH